MFVVEDSSMVVGCVLGRDFLSKAGLVLVAGATLFANGDSEVVPERDSFTDSIMSIEVGDMGEPTGLIVCEHVNWLRKRELERLYFEEYARPVRPANP